jgi:hypothetical protein
VYGRSKNAEFCPSVPLGFLACSLSKLASAITNLDLYEIIISDSILEALASSPAAPNLKFLKASGLGLTDASLICWNSFPNLEHLSLGNSPGLGLASFMAMADVVSLRVLKVRNDDDYIPTMLGIFLAPGALPNLHTLHIGGVGAFNGSEDLLAIVRQMTNPARLRSIIIFGFNIKEAQDNFPRFLEICHNLENDFIGFPNVRDFRTVSDPGSTSVVSISGRIDQSAISQLAETFQHVTKLVCKPESWDNPLDLSPLSSLNEISIKDDIRNCGAISAFPSSLRILNFSSGVSTWNLNSTADTVCGVMGRTCPNYASSLFLVCKASLLRKNTWRYCCQP